LWKCPENASLSIVISVWEIEVRWSQIWRVGGMVKHCYLFSCEKTRNNTGGVSRRIVMQEKPFLLIVKFGTDATNSLQ
jgi:hypothetical protein